MSITGVFTGRPSIRVMEASSGRPSAISATSVLVPPMSSVIRSRKPVPATLRTAPTAPAAGPENSAEMALRSMASAGIRPPLDCMIENRPAKPRPASAAENRLT